jgi:hypothetical protein
VRPSYSYVQNVLLTEYIPDSLSDPVIGERKKNANYLLVKERVSPLPCLALPCLACTGTRYQVPGTVSVDRLLTVVDCSATRATAVIISINCNDY